MFTIRFTADPMSECFGNFETETDAVVYLAQHGWSHKYYGFTKDDTSVVILPLVQERDISLLEQAIDKHRTLQGYQPRGKNSSSSIH